MIRNKVMKMNEFDNAVFYKVDCACSSDEHISTIEIEHDKEINDLTMSFYKTIAWCSHWGQLNWFEQLWKRIKASIKILFTGYIDLEESFIIEGGDHIDAFIEALTEGRDKINRICEKE